MLPMKVLIYTQSGKLGGSFRLLLNLAKHLAKNNEVVFAAPTFESQLAPLLGRVENLKVISTTQQSLETARFDAGLFHLPHSSDNLANANIPHKSLVVLELMSLYPLKLSNDDIDSFSRVIYMHDEQLEHLSKLGCEGRSERMSIINDVDFDLPFTKTGKVASIGVANFKHDLSLAMKMLEKTENCRQLNIYTPSRRLEYHTLPDYQRRRFWFLLLRNKLRIRPVETDLNRLYSGFDCLFHIPKEGNGTSMVVSNSLALGKPVVLSSLPAYRKAYGSLTGVYFADDIDYELTSILKSISSTGVAKIRNDYRQCYDRDRVLQQWQNAVLGN